MAKKSPIIEKAPLYVQNYLLQELSSSYFYHNFDHAEEVANVCQDLVEKAGFTEEEQETLVLAAWFHDCGYAELPSDVVTGSIKVAKDFLESESFPTERIEEVANLIRSVHSNDAPSSDLEKILRDANYSLFGRKRFFRRTSLLRLENEEIHNTKLSYSKWNQEMLDMLIEHKFYTIWAQEAFSSGRNKNIEKQRQNLRKAKEKGIRKKTGKDFGRGVDTLYRVTISNHIDLSNIADGKANMIISINTLVLSILITASAAGLSIDRLEIGNNLSDALPVLILMATSLTAIIFGVLSALPKVSGENFTEEDVKNHKVSLLFFGNFLRISKPKFVEHIRELKKDQELLYDDLSRDLYNLGGVLKTKYRLLNISYRIFIGGLIASFFAFLLSFFL